MEEITKHSVDSLIDLLHIVHLDNSRMQYYAKKSGGQLISTMPLTPFVYEFFLFNSLYQVDWQKSNDEDILIFHDQNTYQKTQQSKFIKFLKTFAKKNPSAFYRAFEPLVYLPTIKGEWTNITPDANISEEMGKKFFERMRILQELIEECSIPNEMIITKKVIDLIENGTSFIYSVRNNVFHGSKTLGDIYEVNQKRRIEVYELFLKGITSLFFLSMRKNSVASDFIQCSIFSNSFPISDEQVSEVLDQNTIWRAINNNIMKNGDSRLIYQFTTQILPSKVTPSQKSALFYPSAGKDMLTPVLLGLPYCTQFYFFERGQMRGPAPRVREILRKIPNIKIDNQLRGEKWEHKDNEHYFDFEYNGIPRRIHWVHLDNLEFLDFDVDLSFYFHRGDSWGEGGSTQKWDSELLPKLRSMIPIDKKCLFLTDGEPGGVNREYLDVCSELSIPFSERERKYYCGYLSNDI